MSVFDLVQNTSHTLPFENNKVIARLALSPNGVILLSVDVEGRALLINLPRKASDTVSPCGPATNRAHCGRFLVTPQHIAHAPLVMSICTWPAWRKYCLAAASRRDFLSGWSVCIANAPVRLRSSLSCVLACQTEFKLLSFHPDVSDASLSLARLLLRTHYRRCWGSSISSPSCAPSRSVPAACSLQ